MNRSLGAGDVMPGPFSLLIVVIHRESEKGSSRILGELRYYVGAPRPLESNLAPLRVGERGFRRGSIRLLCGIGYCVTGPLLLGALHRASRFLLCFASFARRAGSSPALSARKRGRGD